jgi:hypothetical protein
MWTPGFYGLQRIELIREPLRREAEMIQDDSRGLDDWSSSSTTKIVGFRFSDTYSSVKIPWVRPTAKSFLEACRSRAIKTIFSGPALRRVTPEAQNPMVTTEEVNSFLDKVDSIQGRFLESLITGHRDAIFGETRANPKSDSDDDGLKTDIDSQRATF